MQKFRVPQPVMDAIQRYHKNCANQKDVKWDKKGDLEDLFVACRQTQCGCEAVSGTFWIHVPFNKGHVVVKISRTNFIDGGEILHGHNLIPKEPFNRFADIDLI